MTDKEIVERAKEAEKRTDFGELVHSPISKGVNSAFGIGFIEGMVEYRNSMQEEPVSEGLEEAANDFAEGEWDGLHDNDGNALYDQDYVEYAFKAGAEWQKEQMMAKAVDVTVTDIREYKEENEVDFTLMLEKGTIPYELEEEIKVIVIKED